jgi:hypothetical protein
MFLCSFRQSEVLFIVFQILRSSAYREKKTSRYFLMSFMKREKSKGPKWDPWGIEEGTGMALERQFLS